MLGIIIAHLEQLPFILSQQQLHSLRSVQTMRIEGQRARVVAGHRQSEEEESAGLCQTVHDLDGLHVANRVDRIAVATQTRVLDGREARRVLELLYLLLTQRIVEQVEHVAPHQLSVAIVLVLHARVVERGYRAHADLDRDRLHPRQLCAQYCHRLALELGLVLLHHFVEHDVAIASIGGHGRRVVELIQIEVDGRFVDLAGDVVLVVAHRVAVRLIKVPVLLDGHVAMHCELVVELGGYFVQWRPMHLRQVGIALLIDRLHARLEVLVAVDAVGATARHHTQQSSWRRAIAILVHDEEDRQSGQG